MRLPKLDALTSLRFFAAVMVVLQHADLHFWQLRHFSSIDLKQGVTFFFVLSGFILFYNYPLLKNKLDTAKFLVARFARVAPAAIAAAIFILTTINLTRMFLPPGNHAFWIICSEFAMIKSWIPRYQYYLGVNPPSWSISTELFFYAMFPLLVTNFKTTWRAKLLCCASLTGSLIASAYFIFPEQPKQSDWFFEHWLLYFNPAIRLFEFALGMCAAYAFTQLRTAKYLSKELLTCFQIMSFALVCFSLKACLMPIAEIYKPLPSPLLLWIDGSGACFAFALFIFTMAFSQGGLARILSLPPLVFLGEISYSLYLIHWPCERWLAVQMETGVIPVSNLFQGWVAGVQLTALMLGASSAMYFLVEKPFRKLITAAFAKSVAPHDFKASDDFVNLPKAPFSDELVASQETAVS